MYMSWVYKLGKCGSWLEALEDIGEEGREEQGNVERGGQGESGGGGV